MPNDKFVVDMTEFTKKAIGKADAAVRKIVLQVGARVVRRSPVGDPSQWEGPAPKGYTGGRFRANWQYGVMSKPQGVLPGRDPSGTQTLARLSESLVQKDAAFKIHYLVNNLPYAMALERGWSKQAPAGMVGITVREFAGIVDTAAKEVRNEK